MAENDAVSKELLSFRALRQQPLNLDSELATHVRVIGDSMADKLNLVLLWWRYVGQKRFSILACVARMYLGALPTEANVERVFSQIGNVLSDRRLSMLPATAEALVLVRSNLDILESLQATGELEHLTREILKMDEAESADSDTDSL